MSLVVDILNIFSKMKKEKIIEDFAVSGNIAATVYCEAISTDSIELIVIPSASTPIRSVYKALVKFGGTFGPKEAKINRFNVKLLPAKEMTLEALHFAIRKRFPEGLTLKVITPEYLMAVLISSKDVNALAGVINLCCYAKIDFNKLQNIMTKYGKARIYEELDKKWDFKSITYDSGMPADAKKAAIHGIKKRYHRTNAKIPLKDKLKQIDNMLDLIELSKTIRAKTNNAIRNIDAGKLYK